MGEQGHLKGSGEPVPWEVDGQVYGRRRPLEMRWLVPSLGQAEGAETLGTQKLRQPQEAQAPCITSSSAQICRTS